MRTHRSLAFGLASTLALVAALTFAGSAIAGGAPLGAELTGANEPSLQRILDLFQLPINAGDANPSTSDMPLPLASGNHNISLEKLASYGGGQSFTPA